MIILQPKRVKSMMLLIERMRKINRSLHSTSLQELVKHPGYWDHQRLWDELSVDEVCGCKCNHHLEQVDIWWHHQKASFCFMSFQFSFVGVIESFLGGMIFIMGSRKCTLSSQVTKATTLIQEAQFPHQWKSSKGHTLRKPRETSVSWSWPSLPSPTCLPVLLNSCIKFINWAAGRK